MKLITTKDVVQRYKVSYQTLNYYTNLGFFNIVERRGNKRMYDALEIRQKLDNIRDLKNQGYPLRLIIKKFNDEV
ncbi:MAG: MerR family transcriptional regulator [Candidatus Omnitrophica bacterium]|nr:MerR family transcriptional regulator [Candidatus Omnitrophota bacterium]